MPNQSKSLLASICRISDPHKRFDLLLRNKFPKEAGTLLLKMATTNRSHFMHELKAEGRLGQRHERKSIRFLTAPTEDPTSPFDGWVLRIHVVEFADIELLGLMKELGWGRSEMTRFARTVISNRARQPNFREFGELTLARLILEPADRVRQKVERTYFLNSFRDPHHFGHLTPALPTIEEIWKTGEHPNDQDFVDASVERFKEFGFSDERIRSECINWIQRALGAWGGDHWPTILAVANASCFAEDSSRLHKVLREKFLPRLSSKSLRTATDAFLSFEKALGVWQPGDEGFFRKLLLFELGLGNAGRVYEFLLSHNQALIHYPPEIQRLNAGSYSGSFSKRGASTKHLRARTMLEYLAKEAVQTALAREEFGIAAALSQLFKSDSPERVREVVITALDLEQPIALNWSEAFGGSSEEN